MIRLMLALLGLGLSLRRKSDVEWGRLCTEHQREAFKVGLDLGKRQGEILGQADAFAAIDAAREQTEPTRVLH